MKRIFAVLLVCASLIVPAYSQSREILVAAAASLTDVLNELKPQAEKALGFRITFNFAGSGTLRQQIEQGAPVDVFFSAAQDHMDRLDSAGLLVPGSRYNLLTNSIVLVGGNGQVQPADGAALAALLSGTSLLAIGNPDSVPAGQYAVQALKSLGLYASVEKKLVLAGNVRQVLQFVESGSAPLGIVFSTDAGSVKPGSPAVRLWQFPDSALASPVIYPVAVIAASKNKTEAARFLEFLRGPVSREAFTRAGFGVR